MNITITGRDLALVFGAALLGLLAAKSVEPAQAQEGAVGDTCKQYEVTIWVAAENVDCGLKKTDPLYAHKDQWCAAPEGAEIIAPVYATDQAFFWIKRCKQ